MKRLLHVGCFVLILFSSSLALADHSENSQRATEAFVAGDFEKAHELWLHEAGHGDPSAQQMLGAMYAAGQGVPKNEAEAARWYRMAAEQGEASAQYSLGKMYLQGLGVPKSHVHACAWWLVSSANGNTAAKKERKALHASMTPEETEQTYALVIEILLKLGE